MQNDPYYKIPKLSNSMMKWFKLSPRHYTWYTNHPQEQTPAMAFGSAFHHFVLEQDSFNENFAVSPKFNLRSNLGKDEQQLWLMENEGKTAISEDNLEAIKRMNESLMINPQSAELLSEITQTEQALEWTHRETGVDLKCKMDARGKELIIDLKTCILADMQTFTNTIIYDYPRQGPLYIDGAAANGLGRNDFYFIPIEKQPPYCCSVIKLSRDLINFGREEYDALCDAYAHWRMIGSPDVGYEFNVPFGIYTAQLPYYLKYK